MEHPAIRARAAQSSIAYTRSQEPVRTDQMLAAVPADARDRILNTPKTGFIAIEDDRYLCEQWIPTFGRERALELLAGGVAATFETPLFRPMIQGAIRVLGANPRSFLKLVPRGWGQTYRGYSLPPRVLESAEGRAVVAFEQVHPLVFEVPSYFFTWSGVFHAIYRVCNVKGEAPWTEERSASRVTYELRW